MSKSSKKLLNAKKNHLENFLDQTKKANEIVPVVKQALELTDWNIGVVENAPDSVRNYFEDSSVKEVLESDLKIWQKNLPVNPVNPTYVSTLASGASGTASEVVFNTVLRTSQITQQEVKNWFHDSSSQYFQIQERQNREGQTYTKLLRLNDPLAKEFKEACENYKRTIANILPPESAANTMRNVLNHYIGNLVEFARKKPQEQVKRNPESQWTFVADQLTKPGSNEHSLLKGKGSDHRDLITSLTDVTKNTSKNALDDLKITYTKWLDHLYTSIQLAGF